MLGSQYHNNPFRTTDGDDAARIVDLPPSPTEEQPPPYTPTPDFHSGEASVEFGPVRPFQPTHVPPAPVQHPSSHQTGYHTHPSLHSRASQSALRNQHRPPPLHPLSRTPSRSPVPDHTRASSDSVSDFARDFYSAHPPHQNSGPSSHVSQGSYLPPSGPPAPNRARSASSSSPSPPTILPNDGKPTELPTPGHPLLRQNNVLVYPKGVRCDKCHNTGYKAYDPSSPCKNCWNKYSKPYKGPITYAPWNAPDTNYQRPLPMPKYPSHLRSSTPHHQPGPLVSPPPQPSTSYAAPYASPHPSVPAPWSSSVTLPPGHPGIGGRLCWKCHGSGTSLLFFFDETCSVCRGVGRVFN